MHHGQATAVVNMWDCCLKGQPQRRCSWRHCYLGEPIANKRAHQQKVRMAPRGSPSCIGATRVLAYSPLCVSWHSVLHPKTIARVSWKPKALLLVLRFQNVAISGAGAPLWKRGRFGSTVRWIRE
eukprot:1433715-Amphidinium_carterae.1